MDANGIRQSLAQRLGRPIPNEVWDLLVRQGYVSEAIEYDDPAIAEGQARELIKLYDDGRSRAQPLQNHQAIEDARSKALASFVAAEAAQEEAVRRFRREALADELLSQKETVAFLSSPAASMFLPSRFLDARITPARVHSRFVKGHVRMGEYTGSIEVESKGWRFCRTVTRDAIYGQSSPLPEGDVMVQVAGVGEAVCWSGSVLAVLHQLAVRDLGRRYRWEEGDAARFVLTGDAPPMAAIEGKVSVTIGGAHNTIRLTVRPYVSPVRVAQFYRALQAGFNLRPRRPTSERNLNILAFVSDVINREGKRPTWRALMDRWNVAHPDAQYAENRTFHRDYERAHRVIWAERYGVFGWRFRPENVGKQQRKGKHHERSHP